MSNRFIDKLSGFIALSAEDIAALGTATATPRTYSAKQDLIREGDRPGPVFVMLEGGPTAIKFFRMARGKSSPI